MDFKEYLEQKGGVKSKNIPFYLQWVNKYQDWQIEQVADAVKHFLYYQNHYSRGQNRDSQDSGDNPLWICARKTFREALRLKHRSYQTEKSYIHWLDSFLVFLKNKNPDNIDIVVAKLPLYIKVPSRGTRSFV